MFLPLEIGKKLPSLKKDRNISLFPSFFVYFPGPMKKVCKSENPMPGNGFYDIIKNTGGCYPWQKPRSQYTKSSWPKGRGRSSSGSSPSMRSTPPRTSSTCSMIYRKCFTGPLLGMTKAAPSFRDGAAFCWWHYHRLAVTATHRHTTPGKLTLCQALHPNCEIRVCV